MKNKRQGEAWKIGGGSLLLAAVFLTGCAAPESAPNLSSLGSRTEAPSLSSAPKSDSNHIALLAAINGAPEKLKTTVFQLRSSNPYQQLRAVRALRMQLPEAAVATPMLMDLLGNHRSIALHVSPFDRPDENLTTLGLEALETLIFFGEKAVPALIDRLIDAQPLIRKRVAYALGEIGDGRALEPLEGIKRESDPRVRAAIVSAIKKIRSNYLGSLEQMGS